MAGAPDQRRRAGERAAWRRATPTDSRPALVDLAAELAVQEAEARDPTATTEAGPAGTRSWRPTRGCSAELDDFARRADADLAALLQGELPRTVDALRGAQGARRVPRLPGPPAPGARPPARPRRRAGRSSSARSPTSSSTSSRTPIRSRPRSCCCSPASDPGRRALARRGPRPGQAVRRGRPQAVDLPVPPRRRRHVPGGEGAPVLARRAPVVALTSSFRAVPSLQRLVNAAFAPRMVEDRATLQAGYVPLTPYRAERAGQPSVVALPVPRPYGRWGLTKTAIEASLPDAVGAFVHWLVEKSGWRVTERDGRARAARGGPPRVPALPPLHPVGRRRHPALRRGAGGARHPAHARRREVVPPARGGREPAHRAGGHRVAGRRARGLRGAQGPALRRRRRGAARVPRARRAACIPSAPPPRAEPGEPVPPSTPAGGGASGCSRELHRRRNLRPVEETIAALLAATRAHAAFILRPSGEQALANVLRIAELARAWETSGGISFRGFVEQLQEEAEGEAPEAPIVEEGSEGVRIMTVHRAKGLEFPVVILADIARQYRRANPGRWVDTDRGLCAVRLAGWSPWDLLDHEAEEVARDRAEGVRVAYVAATRARDLLVVPAVGDDPFASDWEAAGDSWIAPLQRADLPGAGAAAVAGRAPACPPFGEDSVLERPERETPGRDNVQPGLHMLGAAADQAHPVVWWDPRALALDRQPLFGIRRQDLIEDAGPDVLGRRPEALSGVAGGARGGAGARRPPEPGRADGHGGPSGPAPRTCPGPRSPWWKRRAASHAPPGPASGPSSTRSWPRWRSMRPATRSRRSRPSRGASSGRTAEESAAATALVESALAHPLLARAREAWRTGRCRREKPDHRGRARGPDRRGRPGPRVRGGRRLDGGRLQDRRRARRRARPLPPAGRDVRLRRGPGHRTPGHGGAHATVARRAARCPRTACAAHGRFRRSSSAGAE